MLEADLKLLSRLVKEWEKLMHSLLIVNLGLYLN